MTDWQTIETAPKQGSFLVWNGKEVAQASRSSLDEDDWDVFGYRWPADIARLNITHWHPLPDPPA